MKRFFPFAFLLPLFLLGFSAWFILETRPASLVIRPQKFLITKGTSASEVGINLKSRGFIKNSLAFKFYTQLTGKASKIQAGEYLLSGSLSLPELVSQILKGPVEFWVTIPEGLRREEVVEKIIRTLELSPDVETEFRQEFIKQTEDKEGYLFPDTYLFAKTVSAQKVVDKMTETFDKKVANLSLSNEMLILASLVERETRTSEERPIVAGILAKRSKFGWPLQVDASVQYAVGTINDWWPSLRKEDLNISSPFNTYKYKGLPPYPIANPSLDSIRAVVESKDSPYWFYLHDEEGEIHYARDLAEHQENIRIYLGK